MFGSGDKRLTLHLTKQERKDLIAYYETDALPNFIACNEDDVWYGYQVGDKMFDLNVWDDEYYGGKSGVHCTVYLCEPTHDNNWTTTLVSCPLYEESDT